jgi:hypothetical protein
MIILVETLLSLEHERMKISSGETPVYFEYRPRKKATMFDTSASRTWARGAVKQKNNWKAVSTKSIIWPIIILVSGEGRRQGRL